MGKARSGAHDSATARQDLYLRYQELEGGDSAEPRKLSAQEESLPRRTLPGFVGPLLVIITPLFICAALILWVIYAESLPEFPDIQFERTGPSDAGMLNWRDIAPDSPRELPDLYNCDGVFTEQPEDPSHCTKVGSNK